MLECMEIISIATQKGINIYTVKGNWQLDGSIQSKVVAMVFSMASEIKRDLISKRTKEALQTKRASGMKLGRPKGPGKSKLDDHKLKSIRRSRTRWGSLYSVQRRIQLYKRVGFFVQRK